MYIYIHIDICVYIYIYINITEGHTEIDALSDGRAGEGGPKDPPDFGRCPMVFACFPPFRGRRATARTGEPTRPKQKPDNLFCREHLFDRTASETILLACFGLGAGFETRLGQFEPAHI